MRLEQEGTPAVVRAAIAGVEEGVNVVITGPPGAGQAAIVNALCEELSMRRAVARISGTQAWASVPFAALHGLEANNAASVMPRQVKGPDASAVPSLPTGPQPSAHSGPGPIARMVEQLINATKDFASGPKKPGVIIVENPRWLDAGSVGVIAKAAERERIPVIVVARTRRPCPAAIPLLRDIKPGLHLEIPLLRLEEVAAIAEEICGGPVELETLSRIAALSGCLQEMVVGITTACLHHGLLTADKGVWRSNATGPVIDPFAGWIENLLIDVSPRQQELLTRLAAHPVRLARIPAGHSIREDIKALTELGTLKIYAGKIGVYPPALADYLRAKSQRNGIGAGQDTLAELLGGDAGGRASGDCASGDPEASETAEAEGTGHEAADGDCCSGDDVLVLSRRIRLKYLREREQAYQAWQAEPTAGLGLNLVQILRNAGAHPEEIRDVIEGSIASPEDNYWLLLHLWWAFYVSLSLRDVPQGMRILDRLEREACCGQELLRTARDYITVTSGADGRLPHAPRLPVDDSCDAHPERRNSEQTGLGVLLTVEQNLVRGFPRQGLCAARAITQMDEGLQVALAADTTMALLLDAQVDKAVGLAHAELAQAEQRLDLQAIFRHAYVCALAQLLAGRLEKVHECAERAILIGTAKAGHSIYQVGLHNLAVAAELLRGNTDRAVLLAKTVAVQSQPHGPFPGMLGITARLLVTPGTASDVLWDVATEAARKEQYVLAVCCGLVAVEHNPGLDRVRLLQSWVAAADSLLLTLLGQYAAALGTGSAEQLLDIADRLAANGVGLFAARARVQASLACYKAGDTAQGFRLAAMSWAKSAFMGPQRSGLFRPLHEYIGITEREAEAVLLGLSSDSSREIGEKMHLSPRTVQGYLYSAYRKTGTNSRDELALACSRWLQP